MAENSKIEWCDHTFNPVVGCTKISPACDHCYAENWAKRAGSPELWEGERRRTTPENWNKPSVWNRRAKALGVRYRVFCASLADVFDNQWDPQWRADLWALIADTPHLDWLLLTKRPQNIAKMLPSVTCEALIAGRAWPWPNVWLGTTAEDQAHYDQRWEHLSKIPAAVKFISYEPALGPLKLINHRYLPDWLICGGESGGNARTMDPAWARAIRDECAELNVEFFFKQMTKKGLIPSDLLVRQFPDAA
jgi:protein gp37